MRRKRRSSGWAAKRLSASSTVVDAVEPQGKYPLDPVLRRDGTSKHVLDSGADKSRQIVAAAGSKYTGYVDGAQTISGGN